MNSVGTPEATSGSRTQATSRPLARENISISCASGVPSGRVKAMSEPLACCTFVIRNGSERLTSTGKSASGAATSAPLTLRTRLCA